MYNDLFNIFYVFIFLYCFYFIDLQLINGFKLGGKKTFFTKSKSCL